VEKGGGFCHVKTKKKRFKSTDGNWFEDSMKGKGETEGKRVGVLVNGCFYQEHHPAASKRAGRGKKR